MDILKSLCPHVGSHEIIICVQIPSLVPASRNSVVLVESGLKFLSRTVRMHSLWGKSHTTFLHFNMGGRATAQRRETALPGPCPGGFTQEGQLQLEVLRGGGVKRAFCSRFVSGKAGTWGTQQRMRWQRQTKASSQIACLATLGLDPGRAL